MTILFKKNQFVLVRPTPNCFYDSLVEPTSWITTPVIVRLLSDVYEVDAAEFNKIKVHVDVTRPKTIFAFNILRVVNDDENGFRLMMSASVRWFAEKILGIVKAPRVERDSDSDDYSDFLRARKAS